MRPRTTAAAVMGLVGMIGMGLHSLGSGSASQPAVVPESPAAVDPPALPTPVEPPVLGVLVPVREVRLATTRLARIERVDVRPGDRVAAGQVVVQLDVRRDLERWKAARAAGRVAAAERERADFERARAVAKLRSAEAIDHLLPSEEIAELRLGRDIAEVDSSRARAAANERDAAAENAAQDIHDGNLRSPFDGIVVDRRVDAGAVVSPGQPLLHLISSTLGLRFAIREHQLDRVRVGTEVKVVVPETHLEVSARVVGLEPQIDAATRIVLVEAELEPPPAHVRWTAGMLVDVYVPR